MLTAAELARARTGNLAMTVSAGEEQLRIYARPADRAGAVAVAGQSLEDAGISGALEHGD